MLSGAHHEIGIRPYVGLETTCALRASALESPVAAPEFFAIPGFSLRFSGLIIEIDRQSLCGFVYQFDRQ